MSSFDFISLLPNLKHCFGHEIIYHECVKKAVAGLHFKHQALIPVHCSLNGNELSTIKFFRCPTKSSKFNILVFKFLDYLRVFSRKEGKNQIFFLESFSTLDLIALFLPVLFSSKQTSLLLLFRYGLEQLPFQGKLHAFLCRAIKKRKKEKIVFLTDSQLLAEQYEPFFKTPLTVLPIPHAQVQITSKEKKEFLTLWWPGEPRFEKGLNHIEYLLYHAKKSKSLRLLLSETVKLQKTPSLKTISLKSSLSRNEYEAVFGSVQAILLPYHQKLYERATSGIFAEAISLGVLPFVSDHTWCAFELKKFDLQELIVEWENPEILQIIEQTANDPIVGKKLFSMTSNYRSFHTIEHFRSRLKRVI